MTAVVQRSTNHTIAALLNLAHPRRPLRPQPGPADRRHPHLRRGRRCHLAAPPAAQGTGSGRGDGLTTRSLPGIAPAERWGAVALTAVLVVCWELSLLSLFVGSLTALAPHALLAGSCATLTALVAVVSGPLLARWARPACLALLVSHWDNAQGVLTDVGQSLRRLPPDATDLDGLVAEIAGQVARRLGLPYVAIVVDDEPVGSGGGPPTVGGDLVEIPLSFVGEPVGTLIASPRDRNRGLSVEDRALLDELAVHIGMTLHAARATRDLQDSRAALITAREEERRRIRRDLHDGLGPTLASLRLHLAAVEALIGSDPERASELVGRLRREVAGTAGQVRSLVYGLRPPMLDELGLAQALRSQVAGVSGLELTVAGAPATGTLPAAVEVALYRIASEAVANVVRHAGATRCEVSVVPVGDGIRLRVGDDGRGLPEPLVAGVGLAAIRERAEELGGQVDLGSGPGGGTVLTVVLPCPRPEGEP